MTHPGTKSRLRSACVVVCLALSCTSAPDRPAPTATSPGSELLYIWAGDADEQEADFLAVVDAQPGSPAYGQIVKTVAVEGRGHVPHHTEYELSATQTLLANGWGTGSTFIFDLSNPIEPRIASTFTARGDYAYPHSYARLPSGHVSGRAAPEPSNTAGRQPTNIALSSPNRGRPTQRLRFAA